MTRKPAKHLRVLTIIVCGLPLVGVARGQETSLLTPEFAAACEVVGEPVSSLCTTARHLLADDHDVLGFDHDDPSADRAFGAISRLLTQSGAIDQDAILAAAKDSLLAAGNARLYCDALKEYLSAPLKSLADVACMRPACLVATDFSAIADVCVPVTSRNRKDLRTAVSKFVSSHGKEFGCEVPAQQQEQEPICAVEEAMEIVVKVDQMLAFTQRLRQTLSSDLAPCRANNGASGDSASCKSALVQALTSLSRTWALGAVISEAFTRNEELRSVLDPQEEFTRQWSAVDNSIPDAEEMAKQTEVFPFNIGFISAVAASRQAIDGLRVRLEAQIKQEMVRAWKHGLDVIGAIAAIPIPVCQQELAEFPTDRAIEADEALLLSIAGQMQAFAPCIHRAEAAVLEAQAKLSVTFVEDACIDRQKLVSAAHGIADFCFDVQPEAVGPIGMRFVFMPCAELPDTACMTSGDLRLLIRTRSQPEPLVIDYPLGISRITARVLGQTVVPVAIPPAPAHATPDLALLAETLSRLLPPAFALNRIGSVELGADMALRMSDIRVTAAGLTFPPLCAELSSRNVSFGSQPDCAASSSLVAAARDALAAEFSRRANGISLPGLPLQLANVRLLSGPGDRCEATGPTLAEMAIASLDDLIAICGGLSLSIQGNESVPLGVVWQSATGGAASSWQIVGEEERLRVAVQRQLPNSANIEVVAFRAHEIQAQVTTLGCRVALSIPIDGNAAAAVTSFIDRVAACKGAEFLKAGLGEFEYFGFQFSAQDEGSRFCLVQPPIAGGPVCMRNIELNNGKPNFSRAVLEDQGRLAKRLKEDLQAVMPGTVTILEVLPRLRVEASVPVVGTILVDASPDERGLLDAVNAAFRAKLSEVVKGQYLDVGPVRVVADSVKPGQARQLALAVNIEYGEYALPSTLELMPSVRLLTPNTADVLTNAIGSLIGDIEIAGNKVYVTTGADGIPVVRCAVSLPMRIGQLKASGTVEWRPGKDQRPRFNGPISLVWATYTPIFAGVDIGEIMAKFDPSAQTIAIGASLALTNGDATSNVMRLTGELSYDKLTQTLTADTGFFVVGTRLARSIGVVDLKNSSVEARLSPEGVAAYLPLPEAKVGIYGSACMASGKATIRLFKSFELADVVAVIILPDSCGGSGAIALRQQKLSELNSEQCAYRGSSGLLCVAGRVNVVSLFKSESVVRTPLGSFSPVISVSGDAGFASLAINASLKRIKVKADVKVVRVTVIFPSVTGIDANFLKRLLENLLKPSIDLESVLKGDIVISANTGKDGEAEDVGGKREGPKEQEGPQEQEGQREGGRQGQPQPAAPNGQQAAIPGGARGPGIDLAFSSGDTPIRVTDEGVLYLGESRYLVGAIDRNGMILDERVSVRVGGATVRALRARQDGLALVPKAAAFELDDGWYVLMCHAPCTAPTTLVAEPVTIDEIAVAQELKSRKVDAVRGFSGLDAGSNSLLMFALPRLVQRSLAEGGGAAEIGCAVFDGARCETAIFRLRDNEPWSYFPRYSYPMSQEISEESLWDRAIDVLGVSGAMPLVSATKLSDVSAIAAGADGVTRALIGGSLVTIGGNGARAAYRPIEFYEVDSDLSWSPWKRGREDVPLAKALQVLSLGDAGKKFAVYASSDTGRALIRVQTADGIDAEWTFSMRQQGRACGAVVKTHSQIGALLEVWSKPPNLGDAQAGRIVQGSDREAVIDDLASSLVWNGAGGYFLTDPMLMFYPDGACHD